MNSVSRMFRVWMLFAVLVSVLAQGQPRVLTAEEAELVEPTVELSTTPIEESEDTPIRDDIDGVADEPLQESITEPVVTGESRSEDSVDLTSQDPIDQVNEEDVDEPEAPEVAGLIPVLPESPVVAGCGDASTIQLPAGSASVEYSLIDVGDGSYIVEARISDSTLYTWGDQRQPWVLIGDVAIYPINLEPCITEETPAATSDSGNSATEDDDVASADKAQLQITTPESEPSRSRSSARMSATDPRLSVSLVAEPAGTVTPGSDVAYTINLSRTNHETSVTYDFTTTLPPGVTYEGYRSPDAQVNHFCTYSSEGHSVNCGVNDNIAWSVRSPMTWHIFVSVDEPDSPAQCPESLEASVIGTAREFATRENVWPENNTASVSIALDCEPNLSLAQLPLSQTVEADQSIQFDLVLSNSGASATGVSITNTLPSGLGSYTWAADGCTVTYPTIVCSDLRVPRNETTTFTVTGVPDLEAPPVTCGSYYNSATFTYGGESSVPSVPPMARAIITCNVDYQWTMSSIADVANPGDVAGFTFAFANTGNSGYRLQLANTLPVLPNGQLWNVSLQAPAGVNPFCVQGEATSFTTASEIHCYTLTLPPGGVIEISATFTVPLGIAPDSQVCGLMSNFATAQLIVPTQVVTSTGGQNPIPGDVHRTNIDTTEESVFVQCHGITATTSDGLADDAAAQPGSLITYTIEVENTGNVPIDNYTFYNNLDEKSRFVELISQPANSSCELSEGIYLDCAVEEFFQGETHTYVFTAALRDNLTAEECATEVTITTLLFASQIPVADQPITRSASTLIDCSPGVRFEMTAVESSVVPGDSIAYVIELENTGALVLENAVITKDLPELPDGASWQFTLEGASISLPYTVNDLAPGSSVTILIESSPIPHDLTLPDSEWCDSWSSAAAVSGTFTNDDVISESGEASVRVNCTGLSIEKQVSSEVIEAGETVTYTINVNNHGNTVVQDVVVEVGIAESGLVFGNWQADPQACVINEAIICEFDELDPDESLTITITADAPIVPTLEQCNPVESAAWFSYQTAEAPQAAPISVDLTPPDTRIVSDAVTTRLDCQPAMDLTSEIELLPGENDRMDAGDAVVYTVTVTNTGNMTFYGVMVISGNTDGLDWSEKGGSIGELAPGESADLTANYTVTQADLDAGEIVQPFSAFGGLDPEQSTGSVAIHSFGMAKMQAPLLETVSAEVDVVTTLQQMPAVEFEMSADVAGPINAGETVTYSFAVTNSGNVTLTDITISSPVERLAWSSNPVLPSLAPGERAEFTASYIVSESDAAIGEIVATGEVTAVDQADGLVTASDAVVLQVTEEASLEPTLEVTPGTTPPATAEVTPNITPDATPESSPGAGPAPGTAGVAEPTAESVSQLPQTGIGNVIGVGQIMWVAGVLGAIAFGCMIGVQRHRS